MNPMDRFTRQAQEAMARSHAVASEFGHSTFEPEHLLVALLEQADSPVPDAVQQLGASAKVITDAARTLLSQSPREATGQFYLGRRGQRLLDPATVSADESQDKYLGVDHLFL